MKTSKELDQCYAIRESGAGLDMTHLNYCPKDNYLSDFKYLHTSIRSNNDQIISQALEESSDKELVTEIGFTDKMSVGILNHLISIDREWIDILEIPASLNWDENTGNQVKTLLDSGMVYEISIKNPETVDRISEIMHILDQCGVTVEYVSLDICPLNFDYEIVNFCKERDIEIIGYNPMGGYISAANTIECFTAPYLLSFAATYCSIVFISSRDLYKATQDARYLNELWGKKIESTFLLKKSVHRLQKPLKPVVHTSIILDEEVYLPYNTPDFVPTGDDSIIMSLGKDHFEFKEDLESQTDLEKEINAIIGNLDFPNDSIDEDKFSIAKSQVIASLKLKYPDHLFMYSLINSTTIAVRAEKETVEGWFKKTVKKDNHEFIISMIPGGRVYFREVNQ